MKCHICKEDNSYWEMVLVSFPKYENSSTRIKQPVCDNCYKNIGISTVRGRSQSKGQVQA